MNKKRYEFPVVRMVEFRIECGYSSSPTSTFTEEVFSGEVFGYEGFGSEFGGEFGGSESFSGDDNTSFF